jgi:hypothetical protein
MSNDFNLDFEQSVKKPQKEINLADYIVSVNEEFPDSVPILLQGDVPLFSSGEISLITGIPKTKKTFLVPFFIAALLAEKEYAGFTSKLKSNILLIDTEQGRRRTNIVIRRIYKLLNWDFNVPIQKFTAMSIRELSAKERFMVLEKAIKENPYSIVFLDGFADLIQNTNDIEECARRVSELMKLAEEHNVHICLVVHTNPSSDKTRGHVGSELQRKCETVILVKKDGEVSIVSPQFCRNKEFEKFSFFVNPNGLPETCELPSLGIQAQQLFVSIFENLSEISYKDLCEKVMQKDSVAIRTAERRISLGTQMGVLKKNDDGSYSLIKT